jgi:hypothetical protein
MKHGAHLGEVDLFGLNDFGDPQGVRPYYGAAIGAAVGAGTAFAARALGSAGGWVARNSELTGLLAAAAVSAGMISFRGTRNAGWTSLVVAVLSNGIRALEQWVSGATIPVSGIGIVTPEYARALSGAGFGIVQPQYLQGGLGLPIATGQPPSYGTVPGVAGPGVDLGGPPVNLLGNPSAGSQQVNLLGGPTISGLASMYGATLFGSR